MTPEDFMVHEVADIPLDPDGPYRIYLMEKRGWNTVDAVSAVASASGVTPSSIRYAGLKDRHALTVQHISVAREVELVSPTPDVALSPAGFARDFVSTRVLLGNSFDITIRRVAPAEKTFMQARIPEIRSSGFPNYFDDQRFGSVGPRGEFLADRLVRGHLKGALRIYLTGIFPSQKRVERERRSAISAAWPHWDRIAPLCSTYPEREMARILERGATKRNLCAAVNLIPRPELAMHIAAYQGSIWNRSLQLAAGLDPGHPSPSRTALFQVQGKAGPYVFYRTLPEDVAGALSSMEIPTAAHEMLASPSGVTEAIDAALRERGVSASGFRLRGIRTAYFKSFYRRAVVTPERLSAGPFLQDDLYAGFEKAGLSFSLPPGSYATMLLKALFGDGGVADRGDEGDEEGGEAGEGE